MYYVHLASVRFEQSLCRGSLIHLQPLILLPLHIEHPWFIGTSPV